MPVTSVNMGMEILIFDDPSPDYVTNLYNALQTIDAHDHSPGNGALVTTAGLSINADLEFNSTNPFDVRALRFINNTGTLTDSGDVNEPYVVNGDLWYNNATGQPVQITSGGGLNFSGTGGFGGDYVSAGAQANYDDTNKVYDFYQSGGSDLAALVASGFVGSGAAPFMEFDATSAHKFRITNYSDSILAFSMDHSNTGLIDGNGRFVDLPDHLLLIGFGSNTDGTATGLVGIGGDPSSLLNGGFEAAMFAVIHTAVDSAFLGVLGYFEKGTGSGILWIQGDGTLDTVNGQNSLLSAGFWLSRAQVFDLSIGLLNAHGASVHSGSAVDDFVIADGAFYLGTGSGSGGNCGIGTTNPGDKLGVNGDVRAIGGFKMLLGPYVMSTAGASGTPQPFYTAGCDTNGSVATGGANGWVAPYAGSIMGLSAKYTNGNSTIVTHQVYKNGSAISGAAASGATGTSASVHAAFAKDTYTFAVGDVITLEVFAGTSTSLTSSAVIMVEC